MNHIAYLKRIRFLHNFLLLCAIAVAAFGSIMAGAAALILGFFVVWKYHRCPKCDGEINTLLPLNRKSLCPTCGCLLKDGTGGEEKAKGKAETAAEAETAAKAGTVMKAETKTQAETAAETETAEAAEAETPTEPEQ